ncbi:hypothetical protein P8452_17498 [Trifolium repens]|nr:hypothetical protein P8452_17498 [Trifolium repens]
MSSFIVNGEWNIPTSIVQRDSAIRARIDKVVIPRLALEDKLIWCPSKDGTLSAKQAYYFLYTAQPHVDWTGWIWHTFVPPSSSFIAWRCFHDKMPTDENLIKRGCIVVSGCNLCLSNSKTTTHLFLSCDFANQIWTWLGSLLQIIFNTNSFRELFESFDTGRSPFFTLIANVSIIHALHAIWLARNGIHFNNAVISIHAAKIKILTAIKLSTDTMTGRPKIEDQQLLQQLAVTPRPVATPSAAVKMVLWCMMIGISIVF